MNSDFQLAKENFDKGSKSFNDGLYLEAERYFNLSLKYLPDRVSTLSSLLITKISLKKINECEEIISKINEIDKDYPYGIYGKALYYGSKLNFLKSNDELLSIISKKDLPNENLSTFYNCLGTNYAKLSDNNKSIQCYLKAINLNSENNEAYFNLGTRYLHENNFEEGWKYYEYRGSKLTNKFNHIKEWNGEDLRNKSILVFSEQALGDSIMFSKYVYSLANIAGKVSFVVNKNITNIFKKDFKNISIETEDEIKFESFDFVISIGSLVKFFYKNKYLFHDNLIQKNQTQIKSWMDRMDKTKPNVGLVWSGSFNGPNQPFRSIQLKNLVKILDLDIKYYGLQNEVWESDKDYYKSDKIIDCGKYDLAEITSIIQCLDLLISVDTGILHISSMLNKETWGIFNLYPDWRWGALDKINPYNSLVKINQTKFNQWEEVTDKIYERLKIKFKLN